eukprot:338656_1
MSKATKLLGISNTEQKSIGSMCCNTGLDWFSQDTNIDLHLNETEKCMVHIQNNCKYPLAVFTLSTLHGVNRTNITTKKILKSDGIFSLALTGEYDKYSPIVIDHRGKDWKATNHQTYMIYVPIKTPSLNPHHYLTIYSSKIYTIEDKQHTISTIQNLWAKCNVYFNMFYLDVLLFCLIVLTWYVGCISVVVTSAMASLFGKYLQRTNRTDWGGTIDRTNTYIVLTLCFISYFYDGVLMNMTCDKLLSLTSLQLMVFNIVIGDYCIDFAINSTLDFDTLCHHVLGWIGMITLAARNTAGGIITLLLLDCVTYFGSYKSLTYWIIYIFVRLIWYNWVCYKGVRCIEEEYVFVKYSIIVWWCFANTFHIKTLYEHSNYMIYIVNRYRKYVSPKIVN